MEEATDATDAAAAAAAAAATPAVAVEGEVEAPVAAPESEPDLVPSPSPDASPATRRSRAAPDGGSESLLVMCEFVNALLRVADATFGGSCLLEPYYSLRTTHYSLRTTHYSLLTTHYSLLTTHCSLLATRYSLLATRYSLLTAHCLLLTTAQARLYWGGLRVVAVDARRGVISRRPKFVFFMLAGPAVPVRTRTRGLLDMGAIAAVLQVGGKSS